jgi:putative transposase
MARPLRITGRGLWHHVMNRGAGRRTLFEDDKDRLDFLDLLAEAGFRWGGHTHAMALMGNHYHLLVHDEGDALSRAIRHVNHVYTQTFNGRRGKDGALLRGRFKSRVVQDERYLAELVRYIHANPVEVGLVQRAGDYPWSSHHLYLTGKQAAWLEQSHVMRLFGGNTLEGRLALDEFVHARTSPEMKRALEWRRSPAILGDEAFSKALRERVREAGAAPRPAVQGERRWLNLQCSEVMAAVASHCSVTEDDIRQAIRGQLNVARQATVVLCVELTSASRREIGAAIHAKPTSVSSMATIYRLRAEEDAALRSILDSVRQQLLARGGTT